MPKFVAGDSLFTWHRDPECDRAQTSEMVEVSDDELRKDATGCTACTDFPTALELEKKIREGL